MKLPAFTCLACAALLVLGAAHAAAGDIPWQKAGDKAPAGKAVAPLDKPAADAEPLDLKKEMLPPQYQRLIAPILSEMGQAEKVLALAAKEADKPEAKRDPRLLLDYKLQAIRFYTAAGQKAKRAMKDVDKEDQRLAIETQYEKPASQKAVAMLLELADAAYKAKDYKSAVGYYQRVLLIDPKNDAAKEGLERIQQEMKADAEARKKGQGASGKKNDNERLWDPSRQDPTQIGREAANKDWTKVGREGEGWKR